MKCKRCGRTMHQGLFNLKIESCCLTDSEKEYLLQKLCNPNRKGGRHDSRRLLQTSN